MKDKIQIDPTYNHKNIFLKIITFLFILLFIIIGGFMAIYGGSSMIDWSGYSIGLFGIIFFIPGIFFYNSSINAINRLYVKNEKYKKIIKIFLYAVLFLILIYLIIGFQNNIGIGGI